MIQAKPTLEVYIRPRSTPPTTPDLPLSRSVSSLAMLRWATTGIRPSDTSDDDIVPQKQLLLRKVSELVSDRGADPAAATAPDAATQELVSELTALRQAQDKGAAGGLASRSDVAVCILNALISGLMEELQGGEAAAAAVAGKATLFKAVVARLQRWGSLMPLRLLALPSAQEQVGGRMHV